MEIYFYRSQKLLQMYHEPITHFLPNIEEAFFAIARNKLMSLSTRGEGGGLDDVLLRESRSILLYVCVNIARGKSK